MADISEILQCRSRITEYLFELKLRIQGKDFWTKLWIHEKEQNFSQGFN